MRCFVVFVCALGFLFGGCGKSDSEKLKRLDSFYDSNVKILRQQIPTSPWAKSEVERIVADFEGRREKVRTDIDAYNAMLDEMDRALKDLIVRCAGDPCEPAAP